MSSHYLDEAGEQYFTWQDSVASVGAEINLRWFSRFVRETDTVVDFGCGGGQMLRLLPGNRIGIEVSVAARTAAVERGLTVVASTSDIVCGSVDVVVSSHALEHTLEPFAELQGMLAILRPGGSLVMLLPFNDWRSERPGQQDVNNHLYTWTPLLITNLLREVGFEAIHTSLVRHSWPRGYARLWTNLPRPLFDAAANVAAICRRERQVHVHAMKPVPDTGEPHEVGRLSTDRNARGRRRMTTRA